MEESVSSIHNPVLQYLQNIVSLKRSVEIPTSMQYSGNEELLLRYGITYTKCSLNTPRREMKQCFKNAYLLAKSDAKYIYTEGYAYYASLPIALHHAWCVDMDGVVYDPTWEILADILYIGIPFKLDYVKQVVSKTRVYGILDNWQQKYPLLTGAVDIKTVSYI